MIQEFHISVTPLGNERYLVRTERVASGVPLAEEQVTWSVEEWLTQTQHLMNDPLLGLLNGTHRIGGFELPQGADSSASDQTSTTLVKLGQELYSALFQGRLRDSWMTAQGIAQHKGEMLRLRLGLKGSRLLRLPWEVMYGSGDPAFDRSRYADGLSPAPRPIAAGTDVIFSRYQPGTTLIKPPALTIESSQPLRILMAIAAPSDQEQLKLTYEAHQLEQELRGQSGLEGVPEIQLTVLAQPGREQLTQHLEQGNYQVFHYAGHSNLGIAGGDLYLVNHKTGLTETLSGDDLAGLLVNNNVCMAVFNSCRGAHTPISNSTIESLERNLAEALVGRGVPAVLAMAERIPDDVALNLTRLFYRNLKQGYPIDRSLSRARQGLITSYSSHQLYWALPVLYLHADFDGYLTGGDRPTDNLSERLLIVPAATQTPDLIYRGEATTIPQGELLSNASTTNPSSSTHSAFLESDDELDMIHRAVLEDNDFSDLGYELIHHNGSNGSTLELDDDQPEDYQQDAAAVADLIQQLSQQNGTEAIARATDAPLSPWSDVATSEGATVIDFPDIPPAPPYPADPTATDDAALNGAATSSQAGAQTPVNTSAQPHPIRRHYFLLPLVGVVGAMAITGVVMRFAPDWLSRQTQPVVSPSGIPSGVPSGVPSVADFNSNFFTNADNTTLTQVAIDRFNHNDLDIGQQAVTALLDRGALEEATAALSAISQEDLENPDISFLRGRLGWEWTTRGNEDYSLVDVQRRWSEAVEGKPDVLLYQTALGFAYYAQDNSEEAIATWCKVLNQERSPSTASDCSVPTPPVTDADQLNAIAGLALAYKQGSERGTLEDSPEAAMSKALQFYQAVMQSDPVGFQPDQVAKTWLWSESAVTEWRSLGTR